MTIASEVHADPANDEPAAYESDLGCLHFAFDFLAKANFVAKCQLFLDILAEKADGEDCSWRVRPR